jgi:gamma-glutamyl-gamma-aminobutyrate hydrolase PuuD
MSQRVFIVNGDPLYVRMFRSAGWKVLKRDPLDADLIQFTGGADVSPSLYGQEEQPRTQTNPVCDAREQPVLKQAINNNIPMAGICRGGQFLNVMCGGRMWQHVDEHAGQRHVAWDMRTGEELCVTSTHHQMMIPGPEMRIILVAKESTRKSRMANGEEVTVFEKNPVDMEAIHYPLQRVFCFQPHPEHVGEDMLATAYFEYIDDLLMKDAKLHQREAR